MNTVRRGVNHWAEMEEASRARSTPLPVAGISRVSGTSAAPGGLPVLSRL
jgi:hypothetical protein